MERRNGVRWEVVVVLLIVLVVGEVAVGIADIAVVVFVCAVVVVGSGEVAGE